MKPNFEMNRANKQTECKHNQVSDKFMFVGDRYYFNTMRTLNLLPNPTCNTFENGIIYTLQGSIDMHI